MKKIFILILTLAAATATYAQQSARLTGAVVNSITGEPLSGITVALPDVNMVEQTDAEGVFSFDIPAGEYVISLRSALISSREFTVVVAPGGTDLGQVKVVVLQIMDNMAAIGFIDEVDLEEDLDGSASQEISSMVILSNDVYLSTVGFQLSPFRFKVRGYDSAYDQKYINGVKFNDQYRGLFNYASVGALNDLTRNGDNVSYMRPSNFTFGAIGGAENINMRAGSFAPGAKATLSYTNRNYYLRAMTSYSTGMRDDGWAFTIGAGGRYSDEGNVKGTSYRNFAYAIAVEKEWANGMHSLSFTSFGSPVERGQQQASFQEVYDLVGDRLYNPNWGYQNGSKRNSRIVRAYDPTAIVSHVWKPSVDVTLTTGLAVHYARYGSTALNWYNGPDPRPDYYRYLPSYFEDSPEAYDYYYRLWRSKDRATTQIDWDNLYLMNELNKRTGDGSAIYMLEERRSDLFEGSINSTLNMNLSDNMKLSAGVGLRKSRSYQFKTVHDLMGSNYVTDVDKFSERDFGEGSEAVQNDLRRPDRRVYKGDKFGYYYWIDINSAEAWAENQYTGRLVDVNYGMKLSYTEFMRNGRMQNGRFPDNSYGKGDTHRFTDYGAKLGLLFKLSGRHFVSGNISYMTQAPLPYDAYTSARVSDHTVGKLQSERIFSADINYIFSLPSLNGRVSVFNTNIFDQMRRWSYYHDSAQTYMNHVLNNINKVYRGVEVGLRYKYGTNWTFDFAGTISEYYYANNPNGIRMYENGSAADTEEKVYIKDYYVGGAPQIAATIGVTYFINYWFLGANINGVARNYIDISPLRRQASNYADANLNDPGDLYAYNTLTAQERLGSAYTIDLSIGKIIYLRNRNSINFNFALNNILNRKNVRTGGYESGRLDFSDPDKFRTKYYYMQGINCFLNASYRF